MNRGLPEVEDGPQRGQRGKPQQNAPTQAGKTGDIGMNGSGGHRKGLLVTFSDDSDSYLYSHYHFSTSYNFVDPKAGTAYLRRMPTAYDKFCPVARTLDIIGERWTMLIVRDLVMAGPRNFQ